MRAARELGPPGVYPTTEVPRAKRLTVCDTSVAGFVGLAARGPLDEPRRLTSWNEFLEVYGPATEGYLAHAVEGFFLNGGASCYVVRVAHRAQPDELPGAEHAAAAGCLVKDTRERDAFRVRALNEGRWGNEVWLRFRRMGGAQARLAQDLELGSSEARTDRIRGFERGALVRLHDGEDSDYLILTEVDVEKRTLRWDPSTPISRGYLAAPSTSLEVIEFEIEVSLRDRREIFRGLQSSPLSRRYAPRVVNEESRLIRLDDLRSTSPPPHHLPDSGGGRSVRLAGGRDGIDLEADDFIGHDRGPAERSGLMALAGVDAVGLLCVPDALLAYARKPSPQTERQAQLIQDAMVNLCESLQDRFAILDAPPSKDPDEVHRWRRRFDSSYAALYYPWIQVHGSGDSLVMVPPSGHVAGLFARSEEQIGVHKAPANQVVEGSLGLQLNLKEEHLGLLHAEGVNVLRSLPGRGIRIWGARTCAEEPPWRHVNVRRLFIMLRRSLEEGTEWAVFEPNDARSWERLTSAATEFLKELWSRGYFAGAGPEDSFFVRCDGATNPREARELGRLTMEIGVAPAIPAEYILFHVVQKTEEAGERGALE